MSFADDVAKWAGSKAIPVAEAIIKKSSERLAEKANTSRFKGGNTPVDTSFLINSLHASIGTLPSGESVKPSGYAVQEWNPASVTVVINGLELGDMLYLGWTAEYAPRMENMYGFARLAAQDWQQIVSETAIEYRSRFNAY